MLLRKRGHLGSLIFFFMAFCSSSAVISADNEYSGKHERVSGNQTLADVQVEYEPPLITDIQTVKAVFYQHGDVLYEIRPSYSMWRPTSRFFLEEIQSLIKIDNRLRPESELKKHVRDAIAKLDIEQKTHLVWNTFPRNYFRMPPFMGEELDYEDKIIGCPLPESRTAYAWIMSSIGEPAIDSLISLVSEKRKAAWETQAAAAEALGWMGNVAVQPLVELLSHKNLTVRIRASAALIKIGEPQCFPRILGSLHGDHPGETRQDLIQSSDSSTKLMIDRLISFLDHEDDSLRWNAAWALGLVGTEMAVDALIKFLERGEKWDIWYAADALGNARDERAVMPLIDSLKNIDRKDPDPQNSFALATALARIGDAAIDPLIDLLRDERQKVFVRNNTGKMAQAGSGMFYYGPRLAAARALAWIEVGGTSDKKSLTPLTEALADKEKSLRINAAKALGQLGDLKAVDPLIMALRDKDYLVRANAAWALGRLGDSRVVEPLIGALDDKKQSVKWTAVSALGFFKEQRAFDALFQLLKRHGYIYPRNRVIGRAFMRMGPDINEKLISDLRNKKNNQSVLCDIIGILGIKRESNAVPLLIEALAHKKEEVRKAAAWCLGEIGDERAVPSLLESLKDGKVKVRKNTAWALGRIGDPAAVGAIVDVMNNVKENKIVRQNAVWALGNIRSDTALPALREVLDDRDVGNVVRWSLKRIQGEDRTSNPEVNLEHSWRSH